MFRASGGLGSRAFHGRPRPPVRAADLWRPVRRRRRRRADRRLAPLRDRIPWASKATDIAHNCGLPIKRVERITEYRVTLKSGLLGKPTLSPEQLQAVAALLHDRMTESVMFERATALGLFTELHPAPMEHVDVLQGGRAELVAANTGLALRWPMTRSTTWSMPSPRWAATRPTSN
jgi:hypothetical protein